MACGAASRISGDVVAGGGGVDDDDLELVVRPLELVHGPEGLHGVVRPIVVDEHDGHNAGAQDPGFGQQAHSTHARRAPTDGGTAVTVPPRGAG